MLVRFGTLCPSNHFLNIDPSGSCNRQTATFMSMARKPTAVLQVDPGGKTWNRLRSSIGMPNFTSDAKEIEEDEEQLAAEANSHRVLTH